ncbi:MAG TPA: hypothetical protein PLI09_10970 [Candidatus Hydrogenedentes bacterium]|nr:hypothetical protein [Candidatus Hydrogenedentota bacterium]
MNDHGSGISEMKATRRAFMKMGALSVCALPTHAISQEKPKTSEEMTPLDYGLSFICHSSPRNSVRFWIESRTRLFDDNTGTWTDFYQCGACKSENTFAERDLFMKDNYDFTPIFGNGDVLVFRRPAHVHATYRTIKKATEMWGEPSLKLKEGGRVEDLISWDAIARATHDAIPLVSQTEITNADTKLRAIIECPIKTMNIHPEKKQYQVDTGPIAFPDLTKRNDPLIDAFSLAFIAFNAPNFADFVVEQLTTITEDNGASHQLYHYSNPFSLPARNRLFAVHGA